MMTIDVQNGAAHAFARAIDPQAAIRYDRIDLPGHVLEKTASAITLPPLAEPPRR